MNLISFPPSADLQRAANGPITLGIPCPRLPWISFRGPCQFKQSHKERIAADLAPPADRKTEVPPQPIPLRTAERRMSPATVSGADRTSRWNRHLRRRALKEAWNVPSAMEDSNNGERLSSPIIED
jgi:hypothetical protein